MKRLITSAIAAGLLSTSAFSDMLRIEAGAGMWQNEFDGTITSKDLVGTGFDTFNTDLLGYDKESKMYAWFNFKHPVPIIPNVRFEYAAIDYAGVSTQSFDYKGVTYSASANTDLTLDQYDVILYYNLLDNTAWITLDVGLDAKIIDAQFNATDGTNSANESETLPVPMGYARARVNVPGTGLGFEGIAKYVSYKGSKVSDYIVKADYVFADTFGLEVGYRQQAYDIDGAEFDIDTSMDIEVDGFFAGAVIKF
jgi:outer membrane protein